MNKKNNFIQEKVAAIIVTYNRKELLKECLEAILNQTKLVDAIFIVDNASEDGTPEFLFKNGYIKKIPFENLNTVWEKCFKFKNSIDFFYIRLPKNEGGAGGFYEGIKRAFEKGYTWIWPMDDDGVPERRCLENLLKGAKEKNLKIVFPIVIDKFDKSKEKLAFRDRCFRTIGDLKKISINNFVENGIGPFGFLIHREVIQKIGFPEKKYFIYGDDVDYYFRMKKFFKGILNLDAVYFHPPCKVLKVNFPFRPFYIFWTNDDLRNYYFLRNNAILFRKYSEYKNLLNFLKDILKYLFFIFCSKNKLKNLKIFGCALFYGLQKKFVVPSFLKTNLLEKMIRFIDYKNYILKQNLVEKKSDTIVLLVTYNYIENIKKLAEFFSRQKNVDILFIDNHSIDGTYEFLVKNYKEKFNIIQTTKNIGGAGGFALGQEWVMERGYEYCIFTEDDTLPLDDDIIVEMLKYKSKNVEVYSKFFEINRTGYFFHFHLVPTWIFQKIGVVNYHFFIRADDGEYFLRMQKFLKKIKNFKRIVINKYYSHVLIKKGFTRWIFYFDFRNWLVTYFSYPSLRNFLEAIIVFIKYIWNAFFILFFDKKIEGLLQAKDAFFDALKKDFSRNEMMLEKYKNFKLEPTNCFLKELSFLEFLESFKKYRLIEPLNRTIIAKNFGRSLSFFVTGKYNNPARVLAFFGKKIVFIEEIDFVKEKVWFFEYENNRLISIPLLCLSGFLAIIFTLIFVPLLMLKLKNEAKEN